MQELAKPEVHEGTEVRRFLARRGAVVIKETRDVGSVPGEYGGAVLVSTMALAIVQGPKKEMSYGVKLERTDEQRTTTGSVFIDFDEIPELAQAFEFILQSATDMRKAQRDYTEVMYSTKDGARFGFYQSEENQQFFAGVDSYGDLTFLSEREFGRIRQYLVQGKSHLEMKGASVV